MTMWFVETEGRFSTTRCDIVLWSLHDAWKHDTFAMLREPSIDLPFCHPCSRIPARFPPQSYLLIRRHISTRYASLPLWRPLQGLVSTKKQRSSEWTLSRSRVGFGYPFQHRHYHLALAISSPLSVPIALCNVQSTQLSPNSECHQGTGGT